MSAMDILGKNLNNHEARIAAIEDALAKQRAEKETKGHRKIGEYDAEIFWSDEDGGFIGIVPSLPGCSAFGETEDEAEYELNDAIAARLEARAARSEKERK